VAAVNIILDGAKMENAAASLANVRGQVAASASSPRLHANALVAGLISGGITLALQAAIAFEKYRFNNGFILGATLAAAKWCGDTACRKGIPRSPLAMTLIAAGATALSFALEQAARLFAS
jgi:hypothetical protein